MKKPAKFDEVQKEIDELGLVNVYDQDMSNSSQLGYTVCRCEENNTQGSDYNIYLNKDLEEYPRSAVLLHEYGHIIFNHMNGFKERQSIYESMIKGSWEKVKKMFPQDSTVEDWSNLFQNTVMNVAYDMEVNSKLLSKEELHNIMEGAIFVEPENFGYKPKQSFYKYFTDIFLDPVSFLEKLLKMQPKSKEGSSDSESSSEGSNEGAPQNSNGNSSNSKRVLSPEDLKDFKEISEKLGGSHKGEESLKKDLSEKEPERTEQEKEEDKERQKKEAERDAVVDDILNELDIDKPRRGTKSNPVELAMKVSKGISELEKLFKSLLKKDKKSKRDLIYLYNRNKLNSTVLVPKRVRENEIRRPKVYILCDVSGSVSIPTVLRIHASVMKSKRDFSTKSMFLQWDTKLVQENKIGETFRIHTGGGTDIAEGIKYLEKYKLKKDDVLLILSDFEDDLDKWSSALQNISSKVMGVLLGNTKEALDFLTKEYSKDETLRKLFKNTMFISTKVESPNSCMPS